MSGVPGAAGHRFPTPEQVRQLPLQLQMDIPAAWRDRNGHVGVRDIVSLFAEGAWRVLEPVGIDEEWFKTRQRGQFDLEHHVHYRDEIHAGHTVSCYNRVLGRSSRRFHGMYFVVNDSTGTLAATLEYLTAGADLEHRRLAVFPEDLRRGLDALIEEHAKLAWPVPVCGTMKP